MTLGGKVALITGGASGIGRATAHAFADAGACVVLADLDGDRLSDVAGELQAKAARFEPVVCNVTAEADVARAIAVAVDQFGALDIAVNNAGIEGEDAKTADSTRANWDRVIAVNLTSVWICMKLEIGQMLKAGHGVIVNTASYAGLRGTFRKCAYSASKHGVIGLTQTAAVEYAENNIRVNAVCPGAIDTPMIDRLLDGDPQKLKLFTERHPAGRLGTAEEIAGAIRWLCGPDSGFVTGQAISVDGGWTAR